MEDSGELHATAILPSVPICQKAGWALVRYIIPVTISLASLLTEVLPIPDRVVQCLNDSVSSNQTSSNTRHKMTLVQFCTKNLTRIHFWCACFNPEILSP